MNRCCSSKNAVNILSECIMNVEHRYVLQRRFLRAFASVELKSPPADDRHKNHVRFPFEGLQYPDLNIELQE
jgi:hypothetical protein